jgi:hypothetical protein
VDASVDVDGDRPVEGLTVGYFERGGWADVASWEVVCARVSCAH